MKRIDLDEVRRVVSQVRPIPRKMVLDALSELEWHRKVSRKLLEWRNESASQSSGHELDAITVLAAKLRNAEAELAELRAAEEARRNRYTILGPISPAKE